MLIYANNNVCKSIILQIFKMQLILSNILSFQRLSEDPNSPAIKPNHNQDICQKWFSQIDS